MVMSGVRRASASTTMPPAWASLMPSCWQASCTNCVMRAACCWTLRATTRRRGSLLRIGRPVAAGVLDELGVVAHVVAAALQLVGDGFGVLGWVEDPVARLEAVVALTVAPDDVFG